jgi:5-methylcytosine-specific restriction endonuclease McrA
MQKHTDIYYKAFGYDRGDYVACEVCGKKSDDTCHIQPRGMGSSKKLDRIENLMAMCRECHTRTEGQKSMKAVLFTRHKYKMELLRVTFDSEWINEMIKKHEVY